MSGSGRLARSLIALTVVLGACSTSATTETAPVASALPPAPPVRTLQQIEPVIIDDGLHRVVVTLPADLAEGGDTEDLSSSTGPAPAPEDATDEAPPDSADAESTTWNLTPAQVAEVPEGATLAAVGGVLGYHTDDGVFVPLERATENTVEPAEPAEDEFSDPTDSAAWLESIEGVQAVARITDSTYAVTTAALEPLEELGVDVAEDAPFALTADPYEPYQWALENDGLSLSGISSIAPPNQTSDADVDGLEARSVATGRGVVVAVIDSGVDFDHRDLNRSAWVNPGEDCGRRQGNGIDDDGNGFIDDCHGWDFGDGDSTGFSPGSSDHGTHVAGVIAANAGNRFGVAGMAPNARIMDLKVDDARGAISASAIARSIRYAVDNGADVVNLSLGSEPGAPIDSVASIAEAVDYAGRNGVLLVVAAGNNGQSLDSAPVYPASFNAPHMLVVAASGPSDDLASFSNSGSAVDLMAPGELILSTVSGDELAFMSGTSQAAPMVAAAAAQVLENRRGARPAGVIGQLLTSADDVEADGSRPPRLNSARALGVEADAEGGGAVAIRNLMANDAGEVEAEIVFPAVEGQFNQPFHWEASLVSLVDGEPFAITDHPVITDGGTQVIESSTNGRGAVRLADDDVQTAAISTNLPHGVYALLIEAIPRTDSTVRLGDAFVAVFTVGDVAHEVPAVDASGDNDGGTGENPDADGQGSTDVDVVDSELPTDDGATEQAQPSTGAPESDETDGSGTESGSSPAGDDSGSATPSDVGSPKTTTTTDSNDASPTDGDDEDELANPPSAGTGGTVDDASGGSATPSTTIDVDDGSDSPTADQAADGSAGEAVDDDSAATSDGPIEIGTDTATNGQWSVDNITPQTGLIDQETLVRISGTFPDEATVWFGSQPAEIVLSNDRLIVVRTPLHAEPQTVDVSLRTQVDEVVLELRDGFAFLRPGDDRPVVETDDPAVTTENIPTSPSTDPARPEDPGFELDPDETAIEAPVPSGGGRGQSGRNDGDRKSRNRQARAETTGPAVPLPNGLSGVPLSGLESIGGVPACNEPLCRTRRI